MEFVLIVLLVIYLVPAILADKIHHPQRGRILALNLGLGWTGVGWIAAALWVWRDWPRETRRPKLVVVPPDGALDLQGSTAPPLSRHLLQLGGGGALALIATLWWVGPGGSVDGPPPGSFLAILDQPRDDVRAGPGERWSVLGEVKAPCRATLIEQRGAWQYIQQLEGCSSLRTQRTGWVRRQGWRRVIAPSRPSR